MTNYIISDTTLAEIANAIRGKTGSTEQIQVSDMANQINNNIGNDLPYKTGLTQIINPNNTFTIPEAAGYNRVLLLPAPLISTYVITGGSNVRIPEAFLVMDWDVCCVYDVQMSYSMYNDWSYDSTTGTFTYNGTANNNGPDEQIFIYIVYNK